MSAALEAGADALAVHRLTRLVTADTITEPARMAVVRALIEHGQGHPLTDEQASAVDAVELVALTDDPPKLAVLITCRWCAGMWVAIAVSIARVVAPRWWRRVARTLALSSVAALLAALEDD